MQWIVSAGKNTSLLFWYLLAYYISFCSALARNHLFFFALFLLLCRSADSEVLRQWWYYIHLMHRCQINFQVDFVQFAQSKRIFNFRSTLKSLVSAECVFFLENLPLPFLCILQEFIGYKLVTIVTSLFFIGKYTICIENLSNYRWNILHIWLCA